MATQPGPPGSEGGWVGRIPVGNLWLLMLYASDYCRFGGPALLGLERNPDQLPDLVAEILAHAVESRLRRHLSLGYLSREEVLHRVRGRIDLRATVCHNLLDRGRVACRFDQLSLDTPRNRFVRAALERMAQLARGSGIRHRCMSLARGMKMLGVSGLPPTRRQILQDRLSRHDAEDRFMVAAAKLAFDLALPLEAAGAVALARPKREAAWVRQLFEKAVGGFFGYALRTKGWQVACGKPQAWQIQGRTQGLDRILPGMRTDIMLDHPDSGRRIVIDTKFAAILVKGWYREETLASRYLYQMYAYLHSQVGRGDTLADHASGLLLHPAIGETVDETVIIQGHSLRFATVDLTESAAQIRERLLGFCDPIRLPDNTS